MTVKQLWSKAFQRFSPKNNFNSIEQLYEEIPAKYQKESSVGLMDHVQHDAPQSSETYEQIVFHKENEPQPKDKTEVLVEAFEKLVDKLDNINDTFNKQIERDEKIAEILAQMPTHAGRQTETLEEINRMLSDAAEVDAELTNKFTDFTGTLGKLNITTIQQSNMLAQMNNTFAASDRYLKHIIEKQNNRFAWMFYSAVGICVLCLAATALTVVLLFNS